jgi:hypothetical protein
VEEEGERDLERPCRVLRLAALALAALLALRRLRFFALPTDVIDTVSSSDRDSQSSSVRVDEAESLSNTPS